MRKSKNTAIATPKIEPGPRNRTAIEKAIRTCSALPIRVSVTLENDGDGNVAMRAPHADDVGHVAHLQETFGTSSAAFTSATLTELEWATRDRLSERGESNTPLNAGLALVAAVGAENELETALAVQMAGCHALTMEMLGRAKTTERPDHVELYGNMAIKLQRTFTAQIEALARMRGKGQQTVRVEHVTVHAGAQAIVGDVHHHPRGATGVERQNGEPPYGKTSPARRIEECRALPGQDTPGNGVPIPGDAERPMPDPRRTVARRARQSKRVSARAMDARDD